MTKIEPSDIDRLLEVAIIQRDIAQTQERGSASDYLRWCRIIDWLMERQREL